MQVVVTFQFDRKWTSYAKYSLKRIISNHYFLNRLYLKKELWLTVLNTFEIRFTISTGKRIKHFWIKGLQRL